MQAASINTQFRFTHNDDSRSWIFHQ